MELELMTFANLLVLYNSMSETKAGPKTFASRARMIERIKKTAEMQGIDLASFRQPEPTMVTEQHTQPRANFAEAADIATDGKKRRGSGVGELARRFILDPIGYPHRLIAAMVNAEIPGAAATAKSVRWYACKMRKDGLQVPERQKSYPAEMGAEQSAEWLGTVRVIGFATK